MLYFPSTNNFHWNAKVSLIFKPRKESKKMVSKSVKMVSGIIYKESNFANQNV